MRTILATTNFSDISNNAVNYAADLALAVNAKLVLMNVIPIPVSVSEVPMPEPVFEEMVEDAKHELNNLKNSLTKRTKGRLPISIEIETGSAEYRINQFSEEENPFAIVMGMEMGTAFERFMLGSKTLFAIRNLSSPVLVVPINAAYSPIRKIGLASDLEDVHGLPFERINAWLSAFNASLDIIHVNKSENSKPGEIGESISLHNKLNKFHPSFHFIAGEKVQKELDEFAKSHKLDLLITIPKKHGIEEIFNEKHSRKIIFSQHIPVLAIHAE